jgi:hypothetical protein
MQRWSGFFKAWFTSANHHLFCCSRLLAFEECLLHLSRTSHISAVLLGMLLKVAPVCVACRTLLTNGVHNTCSYCCCNCLCPFACRTLLTTEECLLHPNRTSNNPAMLLGMLLKLAPVRVACRTLLAIQDCLLHPNRTSKGPAMLLGMLLKLAPVCVACKTLLTIQDCLLHPKRTSEFSCHAALHAADTTSVLCFWCLQDAADD